MTAEVPDLVGLVNGFSKGLGGGLPPSPGIACERHNQSLPVWHSLGQFHTICVMLFPPLCW